MSDPVIYRPEFEVPEPGEDETIDGVLQALRKIGETVANDEGHAFRAVHAKSHGFIIAEIEVLPGLPPTLAQGLFAKPGKYDAVMRLSTTPGDLLPDRVSTPRGVAIKVVGVDTQSSGQVARTQDFILVNGPAFSAPNAQKFVKNLKLLATTTDRMPRTKNVLSAALRGAESLLEKTGHESATFKSMGGHPATHILGETFFSQTPFLYGPYIAKWSLVPVSQGLLAHTDEPIELDGHDDALREAVSRHFAGEGGQWEFRVQLCTDLESMPLEDASVRWPEEQSPFITVARVTAAAQSTWTEAKRAAVDDGMAFDVWHALDAHRPLGSINRVRRVAYEFARRMRAVRNRCEISEPTDLDVLEPA